MEPTPPPTLQEFLALQEENARLREERDALLVQLEAERNKTRIETELRISQEPFAKIFQLNPYSIAITRLSDGCYLRVNDSFLKQTDYSREEIIGHSSLENVWLSSEERENFLNLVLSQGYVRAFEVTLGSKHGRLNTGLLNAEIIELDGEQCILSIFIDLTETRRAAQQLQKTKDMLYTIINNAPVILFALDANGVFTLSEGRGLNRLSRHQSEAVGQSVFKMYAQQPEVQQFVRRILAGEAVTATMALREASFDFWGIPLRDKAGNVTGATGVGVDVTERVLAEKALKRSQELLLQAQKLEAIGRLAGGIAHDFNNLLAVITSYSDMLALNLNEQDPLREDVAEIQKAATRATSLTRQLLAFSRKQVQSLQLINLNDVISDMNKLLLRLIGEQIKLVVQPEPDLAPVQADQTQLEQVLLNLVVNARDAMPDGGTLTIQTENVSVGESCRQRNPVARPGSYVCLTIRDTGHGMDKEIQTHVFEPFFTTKEEGKGTGLGLATVYGIVNQSGGFISLSSRPGKGTTFRIYLPAAS